MELQEQFITDNALSTEQVAAINTHNANFTADLKKGWDGKANENAEGILQGAALAIQKSSGLDIVRAEGEKIGPYIQRLGETSVKGKIDAVNAQKSEWDDKIKNFKGNESLQNEFSQYKEANEGFKQKAAQFDEWETNDYKNKFESSSKELVALTHNLAFQEGKPSFPKDANSFEVATKWGEFQNKVLKDWNITLDDNKKPIFVNKENTYKSSSLSDLIKEDKSITDLMIVTPKTKGFGSKPSDVDVEGVPFKVGDKMTASERSSKIKEYLTDTLGLSTLSTEYPVKFAEYNSKLMGKTPTK
jgi:uncharacterized protein YozE (UPF0346 family)